MANAATTNLALVKPEIGADGDQWGTHLNADLDTLDSMLAGLRYGLTLSTAGSSATFGIAAGAASGMALSSAYTKTTSAWAVGSTNGALDTGTIANSTWYHVWLIQRSDTGVVDVLVSTSASSPTMPTNYDRKRRIGSVKTDGSAQWKKFTQIGNYFIWDAVVSELNTGLTVTNSNFTKALAGVPTGVNVLAHVRGFISDTTNALLRIASTSEAAALANATRGDVTAAAASGVNGGFDGWAMTDTSATIRYSVANGSGSADIAMVCPGYWDPLGQ